MAELYLFIITSVTLDKRSHIITDNVTNNEVWTTDYTNVYIASDRWSLTL